MKKIGIIVHQQQPAICSSMMMHVSLMESAGYEVVLLKNISVTFAFNEKYNKIIYSNIKQLKKITKDNNISDLWTTTADYAIRLKLARIGVPIYLWLQGDDPSESYMRNHCKWRRYLLERILAIGFASVSGTVFVSDSMKLYYKEKYSYKKKSIVVPCLSEFPAKIEFGDRIPNSYVYIGGLSVWQCFDETLKIYKRLRTENSIFHIITRDTDIAKDKVLEIIGNFDGIEIYPINDRTQIPSTLGKFQYGFLIRKDDIVNYVSSPIKFLEYISCGVDVIMTSAVPSYADIVKKERIGTIVDLKTTDKIIVNTYSGHAQDVYEKYFNWDTYVKRYKELFG